MKRVHIVGRKNSGKTTLVVDLVQALSTRGLRVATIKHTHHQHELDTPGKDSWEHRQAGAAIVGVLAKNMTAVFLPQPSLDAKIRGEMKFSPRSNQATETHEEPFNCDAKSSNHAGDQDEQDDREVRYREIAPLFRDVDFVLVEGNLNTIAPKIEVWRADNQTEPIFPNDPGILAVVSDSPLNVLYRRKQFPRSNLEPLIEWLLTCVEERVN